jgi:hypothetical protein
MALNFTIEKSVFTAFKKWRHDTRYNDTLHDLRRSL